MTHDSSMRAALASPGRLLRGWLDLVYPPACPLCMARLTSFEQTLCDPCRAGILSEDDWRCPRCGATGVGATPERGRPCRYCPPPEARYRGALAAAHYRDDARRCVQLFKYSRRLEIGAMLADLMVARLAEPLRALEGRVEWIVPVPLHWRRRAWRGFNQSEILARRLGQALGLPLVPALRRKRATKMQTRVAREKRAENVANAFEIARVIASPPPGVILVDDVVTTAHTAMECSRVLAAAGSPEVWVACFARA